ncbi:hypothetical protein I4U23_004302 [Adineta vaga]|nr:hypothetical protein I4U23_004302 [Adineta vaga]
MDRKLRAAVSVTRDGTVASVVRVTRIKSHSRKSFTIDKQSQTNVPVIKTKVTPTNIYENMKTIFSTQTEQNNMTYEGLFSATNVNTTPFMSIIGEKLRNTTPDRSTASTNFSSKIAPLQNHHLIPSTKEGALNKFKSSRLSFGDRRQLYTVGKEDMKRKRCCKFCISCSPFTIFLLALLISLLVAAITAIPASIITMQKTTATTTTMKSTLVYNVTTTTTTTTSTTSTVTDTSTTTSTTSAASTVSMYKNEKKPESKSTDYNVILILAITSNICTSMITGIEIVASCYPCATFTNYGPFSYNYTAISNFTRIAFAFRRQTGYFALDNISVQDFTALGTELIVNGDFETGDLTSWAYCDQNNVTSTGGVQSTFSDGSFNYFPKTGTHYYVGGSILAADYIMQTFPTIIGHKYRVFLWAMHPGSGALTSCDFFLGI